MDFEVGDIVRILENAPRDVGLPERYVGKIAVIETVSQGINYVCLGIYFPNKAGYHFNCWKADNLTVEKVEWEDTD